MAKDEGVLSWLDHFHLTPGKESAAGFDVLCRGPFAAQAGEANGKVRLLPGVDVLDLYGASERTEVWKDGRTAACLAPSAVVGWEFYSLLWPQPGGTSQLRLSAAIELMVGRPPGGELCPSLLFALVPASHLHASSSQPRPNKGSQGPTTTGGGGSRNVQTCERLSGNLDMNCRTLLPRLLVLCPSTVYRDAAVLPDEQNWGLFIGPRSRALVLLNKQRGRIDLHLASLFAVDACFRLCRSLVAATARLFEPFGSQGQVPALFGADLDPLKVHSGLTNATVADHADVELDGREDYQRLFGVSLPSFFLSNASSNLLFLAPTEAHQVRAGAATGPPAAKSEPLPDMPRWTLCGPFTEADRSLLHAYRARVPVRPEAQEPGWGAGLLQLLGFDTGQGGGDCAALAGCTEIAKGEDRSVSVEACPAPGGAALGPQAYDGAVGLQGYGGPVGTQGYGGPPGAQGYGGYGGYAQGYAGAGGGAQGYPGAVRGHVGGSFAPESLVSPHDGRLAHEVPYRGGGAAFAGGGLGSNGSSERAERLPSGVRTPMRGDFSTIVAGGNTPVPSQRDFHTLNSGPIEH